MRHIAIKVEHLSKSYRLGQLGTNSWIKGIKNRLERSPDYNDAASSEKLRHQSGINWSLRDVSFDVEQGGVYGIIGRNGAGKSTLLKVLSKITRPTLGEVKINGRVCSLLEVGTGFHPDLTGGENIFLNGAILGMSRREIRAKFDEIVDFSGVEKYINTPVKRYSSGMYVRLAFAVAAHLEPEILILDEVLAVGDMEFQKKCLGKIDSVANNDGRTVLFVSHNMSAVVALTKRCVYLDKGTVKFLGDTREAIDAYLAPTKEADQVMVLEPTAEAVSVIYIKLDTSILNNIQEFGKPLVVEFRFHVREFQKGTCFSFKIVDNMERAVIHSWISDYETSFCREPGKHIFTCTFPQLRLNVGDYYLLAHLSEPPGGKLLQMIEYACPFKVDFSNEYRLFPFPRLSSDCVYVEDFSWTRQ